MNLNNKCFPLSISSIHWSVSVLNHLTSSLPSSLGDSLNSINWTFLNGNFFWLCISKGKNLQCTHLKRVCMIVLFYLQKMLCVFLIFNPDITILSNPKKKGQLYEWDKEIAGRKPSPVTNSFCDHAQNTSCLSVSGCKMGSLIIYPPRRIDWHRKKKKKRH